MSYVKLPLEQLREMEIMAAEDIAIGTDMFSPICPLAFSLYDSFLSSHCSCCFSLLPTESPTTMYCSAACALTDSSAVAFSQTTLDVSPLLPSDIRTALRLLNSISFSASLPHRFGGLVTNHHLLMADSSFSLAIKRAANFMGKWSDRKDTTLEEAAICSVLTNAVEVQDSNGRALGIAVYDPRFSWINHSCSPNACYRFLISPPTNTEQEEFGPKVTVRSIKRIKSGEEITVSYIDLLQPTGLRQSDLWSKYRFMCSCGRCAASPLAYVDSILEGVIISLEPAKTTVGHHHHKDEAVGKMTDDIKETIHDFLSDSIDPKTCCEKIESVLHHGIQVKANSQSHQFLLHPIHHVALNAYITLATAYRIRSIDSGTHRAMMVGKALDMSRISAAYSLFLAGATHHLFSAEPSLAISATSFWTSAGESLLDLARNFWMESSGESDVKCTKCHMLETPNSHRDIEENSRQLLKCVTDISQVAWSFLTRGCPYLQKFRSPVDFSFTWSNGERQESSEDQRVSVILLSFHCLLYADLLTDLCYGQKTHLVSLNSV